MEARIGWLSLLAVVAYGMAQPRDAIAVGAARGSAAPAFAGAVPDAVPASATATVVADADTYILDVEPDRGWGA